MAVNDKPFTERVNRAAEYFKNLAEDTHGDGENKVRGGMIGLASYAACILRDGAALSGVFNMYLKEGTFVDGAALERSGLLERLKSNRDDVMKMALSYMRGNGWFKRDSLEKAAWICKTLVDYVKYSERRDKSKS